MDVFFAQKGLKRRFWVWLRKDKNKRKGYKNNNTISRMKKLNKH